MTTLEKIDEYLDRVLTYLNTPWDQRDPEEYEAILAEKAELLTECKRSPEGV